jgi:hypothetical protein
MELPVRNLTIGSSSIWLGALRQLTFYTPRDDVQHQPQHKKVPNLEC